MPASPPPFVYFVTDTSTSSALARKLLITPVRLNFRLLGILTTWKDYRVCWFLNRQMKADFRQIDGYQKPLEASQSNISFRTFHYCSELDRLNFYLFNNRSGNNYLLPELKAIDLILMVKGDDAAGMLRELQEKIRSNAALQRVIEIDPEKLKSGNNLVFDEEDIQ